VARVLGVDPATARFDYVGLNHLGWLRGVHVDGRDQLPRLFEDEAALTSFEEGRLFGAQWLRTLGAIPNEYLHYYYFNRETVAAARGAAQTRGAFLLEQQSDFYEQMAQGAEPGAESGDRPAFAAWDRTRLQREITYMAENREAADAGDRDSCDLESGGYELVALALMRAIALDERTTLILNVRGRGALPPLDADAVVEVPCHVDANGARPITGTPLPDHALGLVTSVKAVERAVIHAAATGERAAALRAFALHPLVDSVTVAQRLLDGYQKHVRDLAYLRD
jgi:6-phospho-beta-glucosidase